MGRVELGGKREEGEGGKGGGRVGGGWEVHNHFVFS